MALVLKSHCKVNFLLNILGRRSDGYHELETLMHPVPLHDAIELARCPIGIHLSCNDATLPVDSKNLVYRAADAFLKVAGIAEGVKIHLEKRIPIAAGLGGGSGNAAITLLGLNQLFKSPVTEAQLVEIAASLGSDIPFFLQNQPALATGRGEQIHSLEFFPALAGHYLLLVHPGFGISTPWAYQQLARFPDALHGIPGRAEKLISFLQNKNLRSSAEFFYNSLEAPALEKYPLLALFQEFFREAGATVVLMSGSGSATFVLIDGQSAAEGVSEKFKSKFGTKFWTALVPMPGN